MAIGTNVANPIDKDDTIVDAENIQLRNMRASRAQSCRRGAPLACIFVSWICDESPIKGLCQQDLQHQTIYGVGRTKTSIQLSNLCRSNIKGKCDVYAANIFFFIFFYLIGGSTYMETMDMNRFPVLYIVQIHISTYIFEVIRYKVVAVQWTGSLLGSHRGRQPGGGKGPAQEKEKGFQEVENIQEAQQDMGKEVVTKRRETITFLGRRGWRRGRVMRILWPQSLPRTRTSCLGREGQE